ncbi:unnamed protein product [Orchesella dallaii]|uniref:Protein kinase domain-containing protein n=1 Tax=Orchesella dallaii TaxID=48710 RepID=A0ABP1PPH7_9HEXA
MEEWEREIIRNNLDKLIKNTICDRLLIAVVTASGVFSDNDEAALNAPSMNKMEKVAEFYNIIQKRVGGYQVLLKGLGETNQTGAVAILTKNPLNYNNSFRYDENIRLGKGSFSSVYKGEFRREHVAVKKMFNTNERERNRIENETNMLEACKNHENIVQILTTKIGGCFTLIVLELCDTTLKKWVEDNTLVQISRREIMKNFTQGLEWLHNQRIVYVNLKPENILLKGWPRCTAKICGFGLSARLEDGEEGCVLSLPPVAVYETQGWDAPEVKPKANRHQKYTFASDVYSLGYMYCCVITNGQYNIGELAELDGIQPHILEETIESMTKKCRVIQIIKRMVTDDPKSRPSCTQVLQSFNDEVEMRILDELNLSDESLIMGLIKKVKLNISFKLYLAAMEKARNDAEFLEPEKLNVEHNRFLNDAQTHFYDTTKVGNLEAAEPYRLNLEMKIENQFNQVVTENERRIKYAISEAENWISDCLKEYQGLMRKPLATCKEIGGFIEAHNDIKEKVSNLFHSKWYYKTQTFKNEFLGQLMEVVEETFVELKDQFEMRRARDAFVTKEARKFYHEEMEKYFKNDQFIQLHQLQALHARASRNAIKRCTDKTPLKDTQIEDLKQSLGKSFNKYQEKNDISLNWDCGNEPAIGIDLGTTYCCVAVYFKGKVQIIRNSLGSNTTPSYVAFSDDGSRVIGQAAKDNAFRNPENTIFNAKRMIGRELQDKDLQNDMKFWPFKVVDGAKGPAVEIHGKQYLPEQIGSFLLAELRDQAQRYLKIPINKAVITVPAYFNDRQRAATVDAGEMAGLEVLQILNEPTAAAIAYKLECFHEDARTMLIFDVGGGTYDLAILKTEEEKIEVLGVDGDTNLGGEDFDNNMMKHCAKAFLNQHGIDLFEGTDSLVKEERDAVRRRLGRLITYCEKNKIDLTTTRSTIVTVDSLVDGKDLSVKVTRAEFEEMNEQHFKKTIDIVDRALKDVGVRKEEIDDIVLVGGSTRIPKVKNMLDTYFNGKYLTCTLNPDEAVAYGAAVQAAILNWTEAKKALKY